MAHDRDDDEEGQRQQRLRLAHISRVSGAPPTVLVSPGRHSTGQGAHQRQGPDPKEGGEPDSLASKKPPRDKGEDRQGRPQGR